MKVVVNKNSRYVYFNSFHMQGMTFGEYMDYIGYSPKFGENTPVKKKYNELKGCHYYLIEIK